MVTTVPLIRAANVVPLVRFLEANGQDAAPYLDAADLGYWFALSPLDPLPLRNGIELLSGIARSHGPDVGARIVSQASIGELAFIGRVALGSRTPAEAMRRISAALPLHSSHEMIRVEHSERSLTLVHRLLFSCEPDDLHAVHVLLCSMIQQLCKFTGIQPPVLSRIVAMPHSEVGIDDMLEEFGQCVAPGRDGKLEITLATDVAQNPFRIVARDRLAAAANRTIPPLAEDSTLAGSVRPVIAAMMHGSEPTIERVARSAGMSVRTLQRRLAGAGTSFSNELDSVRQRLALSLLQSHDASLADITERLGYSSRPALSRAVRRMVGASPGRVRSKASR